MVIRRLRRTAVLALVVAGTSADALPLFTGIGDVPGGAFESYAYAVSRDGTTVVGSGQADVTGFYSELVPIRWTAGGGIEMLFAPAPSESFPFAADVSNGGEVVVGSSVPGGWRWTAASGSTTTFPDPALPFGETQATSVSADGGFAAGAYATTTTFLAIRWHGAGGSYDLIGDLPGGGAYSWAFDLSADGGVVVGCSDAAAPGSCDRAFRWTAATGIVDLGDLAGGSSVSTAYGVSADGNAIVGTSSSALGGEAFLWTSAGGMIGLGDLPGGAFVSEATAVSADGALVVGRSYVTSGPGLPYVAFIWDPVNGMRDLREWLEDQGVDLAGWTLLEATDVSDDGRTIVGNGIDPDGRREGWVVVLPEPGAGLLLALAGLAAARRRGRARAA
jgi:probable HAF family extracellular repeat protein